MEWVRFAVTAILLIGGLGVAFAAITGIFRFKFALNRLQAASIVDTLAMMLVLLAMSVVFGISWTTLKILFIIIFMWIAGPVSSHLITKLEAVTDPDLGKHMSIEELEAPGGEEKK